GFGRRRKVRHNAIVLEGVEAARAAIAALHLVGYPDDAVPVAEDAQRGPEGRIGLDDTATALYRLKYDSADLRVGAEGVLHRLAVAEGHAHRIVGKAEFTAVELAIGDRQNALGFPVERVLRVDDLRPLRPRRPLGELDGRLHDFGAGRAQKHHVEVAGRALREIVRERRRVLRHEGNRDLVALLLLE